MAILNFEDILRKAGLDPAKVKLIRHSLNDKGFKECYDCDMVYEYTCHQKQDFSRNYDYWIVFISDKSTYCRLYACYKANGYVPDTPDTIPEGYPENGAKAFKGEYGYYDLEYVDILEEYENRLIIDWGNGTRMWHQKGSTEKPVIAIQREEKYDFPGYERLLLTYEELKNIVDNPILYSDWHAALSSVNAVYLITNCNDGRQYVGSAYGSDGLLGRWSEYAVTGHGNNKKMISMLEEDPESRYALQFSILQILPKIIRKDDPILSVEALFKRKLHTIEFGLNDN